MITGPNLTAYGTVQDAQLPPNLLNLTLRRASTSSRGRPRTGSTRISNKMIHSADGCLGGCSFERNRSIAPYLALSNRTLPVGRYSPVSFRQYHSLPGKR